MQATVSPEIGRGRKNVLLVFYPLAFSPVCSHQLPMIQRDLDRFHARSTEVLGISVDSHYANEAFARHLLVTFPLLSDFHRKAARDNGVLLPEHLYSGRALFLIDREGKIAYRDVSPTLGEIPRNEPVLEALARLA
ncbi:MAG: redoxin domain-containing protein [Candidatus Eisenbacteria bacterium]|uniref:Redoxin domain-containing protein n=1 Tax=Eiseniibacteriota bacterium TaxID=2212470 RepID=A0A538U626_UNCEI|nr:MAG: redoxin domain-containing protein [Candidatus Eisenbacteria bacterium]